MEKHDSQRSDAWWEELEIALYFGEDELVTGASAGEEQTFAPTRYVGATPVLTKGEAYMIKRYFDSISPED